LADNKIKGICYRPSVLILVIVVYRETVQRAFIPANGCALSAHCCDAERCSYPSEALLHSERTKGVRLDLLLISKGNSVGRHLAPSYFWLEIFVRV